MHLLVPSRIADERQRQLAIPERVTHTALNTDLFWTTEAVVEQAAELGVFPRPRGYHVAVMLVKPATVCGGVELPDSFIDAKSMASTTGVVIAIGPRAYQDKERFPDGPDCAIGEVVLIPKYCGQVIRLPTRSGEATLSIAYINDDQITAGWGDMTIHATEPAEPRTPVAAQAA
jgi:co-chaperonin GroES (HSP10)